MLPAVCGPCLRGDAVITCPKCFKENQDHYKFCLGCGAELTAPKAGGGDVAMMKTMMADPSQAPVPSAPVRGSSQQMPQPSSMNRGMPGMPPSGPLGTNPTQGGPTGPTGPTGSTPHWPHWPHWEGDAAADGSAARRAQLLARLRTTASASTCSASACPCRWHRDRHASLPVVRQRCSAVVSVLRDVRLPHG